MTELKSGDAAFHDIKDVNLTLSIFLNAKQIGSGQVNAGGGPSSCLIRQINTKCDTLGAVNHSHSVQNRPRGEKQFPGSAITWMNNIYTHKHADFG